MIFKNILYSFLLQLALCAISILFIGGPEGGILGYLFPKKLFIIISMLYLIIMAIIYYQFGNILKDTGSRAINAFSIFAISLILGISWIDEMWGMIANFPMMPLFYLCNYSGEHIPHVFYFVSLIPTFLMWLGLERRIY